MGLVKFAQRLKELMELDGISQRSLAIKINVDTKCLRLWLKGIYFPKYNALIRLSEYFQVRIDYLIGLEDVIVEKKNKEIINGEKATKTRFHFLLYQYIQNNNLSKYAFAKRVKIDQKAITKWLTVGSMPEIATVIKLTKVMNVSAQELLLGE